MAGGGLDLLMTPTFVTFGIILCFVLLTQFLEWVRAHSHRLGLPTFSKYQAADTHIL